MSASISNYTLSPWAYDSLGSYEAVQSFWEFQLFASIVLGGYVWDTIISLPGDLEFIFKRKFSYVTLLFIISRISGLITLTTSWLFTVYQGDQCLPIYKLAVISEPVTIFTSGALLLVRVHVLYKDNIFLMVFMILFLFVGPMIDLVEAFLTTASNLPGNGGCAFGASSPYIYLVFLFQGLFDLLCFVLCTFKLYRVGQGCGLLHLGREMMNGGIFYWIPNVIIQIATVILTLQKGSSVQFLSPPAADGIASAQALRITRSLWKAAQIQQERNQDSSNLNSGLNGYTETTKSAIEGTATRESSYV